MSRLSFTTDTIVLSTCNGATAISQYRYSRVIHIPWCHDYQSLLILPRNLHIMVPRLSVPTDAIVLSAHHSATTTSHHSYHRAARELPPSPHRRCRVHILVWWGDRVRPTISQETCCTSQPPHLPTPSCFPHTHMDPSRAFPP